MSPSSLLARAHSLKLACSSQAELCTQKVRTTVLPPARLCAHMQSLSNASLHQKPVRGDEKNSILIVECGAGLNLTRINSRPCLMLLQLKDCSRFRPTQPPIISKVYTRSRKHTTPYQKHPQSQQIGIKTKNSKPLSQFD